MNETLTVIGFDFGVKRIGVAYGQNLTQTAQPLEEIPAKDGIPNWQDIQTILDEYQPELVVTGLPLNMDGTENEMCQRARKFAKRLHGRFGIKSLMWDERLSSDAAKDIKPSSNYKKNAVDSLAAALILESWFENGMPEDHSV
jgi:putative Holliday junction resolvase